MQIKKIIVVGAGPAGMMAAIRAAQLKQDVALIEKNPLCGKKLLLSGKGRCNLTNACELNSFLKRFSHRADFLRDSFKKFFWPELMKFFEERGLQLKIERQQRVFPVSNRSASITGVLTKELKVNKVRLMLKTSMKNIILEDNGVAAVLLSDGSSLPADKVILATGGISYTFTGSTGEGMKIARALGHKLEPFRPGLVPLVVRQHYPKTLEGLTLKNIRIKFSNGKNEFISDVGELMFTGFGISGPLVLSFSGQVADWLKQGMAVSAEIDLKPGLSREELNARILREFKLNSKKTLKNTLKTFLPSRLIGIFVEISKISADKKVSQITQDERRALIGLFKGMHLDILKPLAIEEAMITKGGVSLQDINPRTMESRVVKGLYFAGEMIDVDADTGGFNLQAAFSTGYLAGESAATAL